MKLRELSTRLAKLDTREGNPGPLDLDAALTTTIELRKLARRLHLAPAMASIANRIGDVEERVANLTSEVGEHHRTIGALLDLGVFKRRRDDVGDVLDLSRHQHRALERVHNTLEEYREHLNEDRREERVGVLAHAAQMIGRLATLVTSGRRKKLRFG